MSKSPVARASEIVLDGYVPPFIFSSGRITNAAAAAYGNSFVAPCDLYIEKITYGVVTQFTHASSAINIGIPTDLDAYLDGYNIQNDAAGTYEIDMSDVLVVDRTIPKGAIVTISTEAADTTGVVVVTMTLSPGIGA